MRVSRLLLHDFRGWADLDLRPSNHVLLAGVPRAGRSDIVAALARLLDPAFIRMQPRLADLRRQRTTPTPGDSRDDISADHSIRASASSDGDVPAEQATTSEGVGPQNDEFTVVAHCEVEATLVDLDAELEQLCDGFLEPLDGEGQVDETGDAAPDAPLGVRLGYRVTYDANTDSLEHVVFFPVRSNPATAQYSRVPTTIRRALPVVVLNAQRPLQLRAEGGLRRLVTDHDTEAALAAFRALDRAVSAAADNLSAEPAIAETVDSVLRAGGLARHLADSPPTAAEVRFQPEDGSMSALLRAVQPALQLDEAGLLPLSDHGSTAVAVLAAAEALLLAESSNGAVILGDDFGDGLDAASAEHLAAALRAHASQLWLTTRQPEVARAFAPGELVRLARGGGIRTPHIVPQPTDRKEVAVRRLLHAQLLPALTSRVVAIVEGPTDLTTYSGADRHRAASELPLAAVGVRLISADNGSGGGTGQIPRTAELARAMGFGVIALIDGDPAKTSAAELMKIQAACDVVVRLPAATAIELALMAGVAVPTLRTAAAILPAYGVPDPAAGVGDTAVAKAIARVLHAKGLHEQYLDALVDELGTVPPVIDAALAAVAEAADANYEGHAHIDVAAPLAQNVLAEP